MGRWIAVRVTAFALRHGITTEEVMSLLARAFPHRPGTWRLDLLADALARNDRRAARA